jgi:hypothetical protein
MNTSEERIQIELAKVCHQANKAICEAYGDFSQKDWDNAEEWQKNSVIKGVEFAKNNPDAPASAQHDAWSKDKIADGWVYGTIKDTEKKTHPCLVPFSELPPQQQVKDYVFKAIVKQMSNLAIRDPFYIELDRQHYENLP